MTTGQKGLSKMKRADITPESLMAKGYKAFEFSDWTLERACEYIRNGCGCALRPTYYGTMVGVIIVTRNYHKYEYEVFSRKMTADEKVRYRDWMREERKRDEKVAQKIHARNMAKMRRR